MSCFRQALVAGLLAGIVGCSAPPPPPPSPLPAVTRERSLFYRDAALLAGPDAPSLARLLETIAPGNGGALFAAWFRRFATTAHSERSGPAQLVDALATRLGPDPATWDLTALPFVVTGVHNRIDLARDDHCGELRVSLASVDPIYQPFHLLFIFRQPAGAGDRDARGLTCAATAAAWARLSALDAASFATARQAALAAGLTRARFLLAETLEFTVAPWEWRQWVPGPDATGALPLALDNPPLFQTVDVERYNPPGADRDALLAFVTANADALDARVLELPAQLRGQSARVTQGVPRVPLSLDGLPAATVVAHPSLRQNVEIIGCPACHTTDADFVQTHVDGTISAFYDKELTARATWLAELAAGRRRPVTHFGPLQATPLLPP